MHNEQNARYHSSKIVSSPPNHQQTYHVIGWREDQKITDEIDLLPTLSTLQRVHCLSVRGGAGDAVVPTASLQHHLTHRDTHDARDKDVHDQ